MAGVVATLLRCVLLVAAGGPRLCGGIEVLKGLKGQSLFFPALSLVSSDIVRVIWRTQGTHIAEAKPRKKIFSIHYLPNFRGRLVIHPGNLSLEIRSLRLEDSGTYVVTLDTSSNPTNPKTFSYSLQVQDGSTGTGDTGGCSRSTEGPQGTLEPHVTSGEQPPGGRGPCEVRDHYCTVKGYLVATIFGPLLVLVVAIHVVTRDKATEPRDEVSPGAQSGV